MTVTAASLAMTALLVLPLAAAVAAFVWPRLGRPLAPALVLTLAGASLQIALWVHDHGPVLHRVGGWGAPLGIDLRADGLSALLLLVTAGVAMAVSFYGARYFRIEAEHDPPSGRHAQRWFWPLWFFLLAALNALFLSADLFNLYVALELLGFAAVALVALGGQSAAIAAAMRYLLVGLTGSLLFLMGVALTYGHAATVDLALLARRLDPGPVTWAALLLMTAGLLAKGAVFPLHFWLPPAHGNAPAPVSAALSALVVKGSFAILLRLWFEAFRGLATPMTMQALGALGAGAIVWGSWQALRQERLKRLVAYSTVAQLGYLFLVFPLAGGDPGFPAWSGALFFLAAHACAKTAMFLAAGNILHAAGHDRIRDLDGITHALPVSVFAFALSGVSLVGLPPSSGFLGKYLLLNAGVSQGQWWWVGVILAGSLLAAAYVMKVLGHAFTQAEDAIAPRPIPRTMEWTAFLVALLAVLMGLAAQWPLELLRVGAPVAGPVLGAGVAP